MINRNYSSPGSGILDNGHLNTADPKVLKKVRKTKVNKGFFSAETRFFCYVNKQMTNDVIK